MIIRTIEAETPAEFEIRNPLFGYATIINLATKIQKQDDGSYQIWDNGTSNDTRRCICTFVLNQGDTLKLINILKDSDKGRGLNIEVEPEQGFHVFGCDKGDAGVFKVRAYMSKPQPSIGYPQNRFTTIVEFVFNGSWPEFTPADQVAMGDLQIGEISGLNYPGTMHESNISYAIKTLLTSDGTPNSLDKTSTADIYEATLPLSLKEGNAAALIAHLVNTVRGENVNVIPPAHSYMFGIENSSTSTYVCKLIQSTIEITNPIYNLFNFNLSFYRIS